MNEPQSTTDAGPVTVPDAATPSPEAASEAAEPSPSQDPGAARDADTSEDTLAEHVARTDAALVAWRQDAERRRVAWEAAQARALEQMRAQRRRVVRFAGTTGLIGLGIGFAAGVLFYRTWWSPGATRAADLDPPPSATAPVPARVAPAEPPLAPEQAPDPGAEVLAPVEDPVEAPAVALIDGSARVWSEGTHTWAAFESPVTGELTLRYLDGAGVPALEPMECQAPDPDGIRRCAAGRSAARIQAAVEAGAAPGVWTVQACAPAGCVPVGTFDVPAGAG